MSIKVSSPGSEGGGGASFTTIQTQAGTFPVATTPTDTLNLESDGNIIFTGDETTDTVTASMSDEVVDFANKQLKNNSQGVVVQWQKTTQDLVTIGTSTTTKTNLTLQMGSGQEDSPFKIKNNSAAVIASVDTLGAASFSSTVTAPTFIGNLTGSPYNPSVSSEWLDDFTTGQGVMWNVNNSGTGGTGLVLATTEPARRGVVSFNTGTGTTGRASWYQQFYTIGNGAISLEWAIKTGTLSDGTDTYYVRLGLGADWYPSDEVNALIASYSSAANSGNWQLISKNSSSATTVNTATAHTTAWTIVGITVNAAGTSAQLYINRAAVGSPITTNLPVNKNMYAYMIMVKTAGTTTRSMLVDWMQYREVFTSPR